jgi:biopolymer transport protein ExbB/TolQ
MDVSFLKVLYDMDYDLNVSHIELFEKTKEFISREPMIMIIPFMFISFLLIFRFLYKLNHKIEEIEEYETNEELEVFRKLLQSIRKDSNEENKLEELEKQVSELYEYFLHEKYEIEEKSDLTKRFFLLTEKIIKLEKTFYKHNNYYMFIQQFMKNGKFLQILEHSINDLDNSINKNEDDDEYIPE